jgi:hypothetical protein
MPVKQRPASNSMKNGAALRWNARAMVAGLVIFAA